MRYKIGIIYLIKGGVTLSAKENSQRLLYLMLKEKLVKIIEDEEVKADELIPSERELIERYKVSRTTVRKAIDVMVNEGYLYKIQGKGTYVKGKRFNQEISNYKSCTEIFKELNMEACTSVVCQKIVEPKKKILHQLKMNDNENAFYSERIHYVDDEAINYTFSYINYKFVNSIERFDFKNNSLYKTLTDVYKIRIIGATRTVEAVLPDEKIAKQLGISVKTPVLMFTGWVYGLVDGKKEMIEYYKSYFRSDKSKFYIDIME